MIRLRQAAYSLPTGNSLTRSIITGSPLLERVQKLERRRAGPSPIEIWYGSFGAFQTATQQQIEAGRLCNVDMPVIVNVLRRWHADEVKFGRARRQK